MFRRSQKMINSGRTGEKAIMTCRYTALHGLKWTGSITSSQILFFQPVLGVWVFPTAVKSLQFIETIADIVRHSGESRNPGNLLLPFVLSVIFVSLKKNEMPPHRHPHRFWIPACAGMTVIYLVR